MVFLCALQGQQIRSISPGQQWPGFSFALYLLRVQGFCFALLQYNPIQAFTARFASSMQLYRQRHKTAHKALQVFFLLFDPFNRSRYQTDTSGYNATCSTLERITAPCASSVYPNTTATPGRCTAQRRPPIIIRYIMVQRRAPVVDPCQTVQHIADHASPAACNLAPASNQGAPGLSGTLHPAGQSSSRDAAGGAESLTATAASLFRAFAR